ncbi:MAG: threonylcarbamoyl-AMP synthase [Bacteroidales bacterium]|nr:threonylcarbamoyl-AMP synthase [Bacteroidales bacterium]
MKDSEILKQGKVLIYPTDTIWGIGCDAQNVNAVERIKQIKGRDNTKSFILLVKDVQMLSRYVERIPEGAMQIILQASSPVTIIYPQSRNLPIEHLSFNGSIGIRIAQNSYLQQLFNEFDRPIVSTSANFSGQPSPQCFDDIDKELLKQADYVSQYMRKEKSSGKSSDIYLIKDENELIKLR